jgi:16S rRNA processing protein RimM
LSGEKPRWIVVARILGARGNKGEVAVELLTDFPERLTKLSEVYLGRIVGEGAGARFLGAFGAGEPAAIGVKSCWLSQNHRGQGVFHFAGVDSISAAEKYRGLEVLLPFEQRVVLQAGQYFVADLMGCEVIEISNPAAPESLGSVRDVQFPGESDGFRGTPLLELQTTHGELLIPLALDVCRQIDTTARRIEVLLPEGLRDLNSSE